MKSILSSRTPQIMWLLSLVVSFFYLPIAEGLQVAMALSGLLLAACLFLHEPTGKRMGLLSLAVIAIWGLAAISAILSEVPFSSATSFFFFSAFPLSFLILSMKGNANIFAFLFKAVRYLVLGQALISLVQFFFFPDMLKFGGTHWPFGDNNSLGAILAVGAVLFYGEILKSEQSRKLNLLCFLLVFAALVTTEGRAILLVFLATLAALTLLAKPQSWKPVLAVLLSIVLICGAMSRSELSFSNGFGFGHDVIQSVEEKGLSQNNRLTGSRMMIWQGAIQIWKDHPVIGTGIGTFYLYYPQVRQPDDDSAGYMAHNDLLQMASEMGSLAPVLALMIVGIAFGRVVFFLRRSPDQSKDRLNVLIPAAVFGLLTVHSLVNFNYYVLPSLMLIGLSLACLDLRTTLQETQAPMPLRQRQMWQGLIALMMVPLWALSGSEYLASQSMKKLESQDIQGFAEYVEWSDRLALGMNARPLLHAAQFAIITQDFPKAQHLLQTALTVNPRFPQLYLELAKTEIGRDLPKALEYNSQGLMLDPSSLLIRMQRADILTALGRKDDAYSVIKEGSVGFMRSRVPLEQQEFYQRLATMSLERGDLELNKIALKRLERINTILSAH